MRAAAVVAAIGNVIAVRQLQYPPESRLAGRGTELEFREPLNQVRSPLAARRDSADPPPLEPDIDDAALAKVATGLWRARRRMCRPGADEPLPEMRQPYRHVQSAWDALAEAGVVIQDHDGQAFTTGLELKVVAFQPEAGLAAERVAETVRPSVYRNGRSIQMGEVIVGTPDEPSEKGTPTMEDGGQA